MKDKNNSHQTKQNKEFAKPSILGEKSSLSQLNKTGDCHNDADLLAQVKKQIGFHSGIDYIGLSKPDVEIQEIKKELQANG